ncbi:MAG: hypothetical protein RMM16_06870 [Chloroherpetonaceae bacterium]|nr:hypothetical protein [Chloroherpetonaceae bacterium]
MKNARNDEKRYARNDDANARNETPEKRQTVSALTTRPARLPATKDLA